MSERDKERGGWGGSGGIKLMDRRTYVWWPEKTSRMSEILDMEILNKWMH